MKQLIWGMVVSLVLQTGVYADTSGYGSSSYGSPSSTGTSLNDPSTSGSSNNSYDQTWDPTTKSQNDATYHSDMNGDTNLSTTPNSN